MSGVLVNQRVSSLLGVGNYYPASVETTELQTIEGFPLYAHASGKWAKKIQGKVEYFGSWDDPEGAITAYLAKYPPAPEKLSLSQGIDRFLESKRLAVEAKELSPRSLLEYQRTCYKLGSCLGPLTPPWKA